MRTICLLIFCLLGSFAATLNAQIAYAIPGELIVQLPQGQPVKTALHAINNNRSPFPFLEHQKVLSERFNIHLLRFDVEDWDMKDILQIVQEQAVVEAAQFNAIVQKRGIPNDPFVGQQWGQEKIGLPDVWEITTGGITARGDTIVVAVLDTGFDLDHDDLIPNLWRNAGEIPGDGIDNDNNGFIDDINGWNFRDDDPIHFLDDHGLQVMGILGAKGDNGIGVAGVNWNIKMIPLTIERVDDIIAAYDYVLEQRLRYNQSMGAEGAFIVATNASFGLPRTFCNQQPIWGNMYNLMGNEGILTGVGCDNETYNIETFGDMPTSCTSDFIITTLNTTEFDRKFEFCAYGDESVDLGAPGHQSYSLYLDNDYDNFGGTSAAAPHLTGTIALLYSLPCDTLAEQALSNPREVALSIRNIILESVDVVNDLEGKTVTSGRLNAFRAMEMLQMGCGGTVGDLDILSLMPNPVSDILTIEYETPGFSEYNLRIINTMGQEMYRKTFSPPRFGLKRQQVDVSWLAEGMYYMVLDKGRNVTAEAFFKK